MNQQMSRNNQLLLTMNFHDETMIHIHRKRHQSHGRS